MFRKRKDRIYEVEIFAKNFYEKIIINGKNKKQLKNLITSVLINCCLFPFKSKKDFKIKVKYVNQNKL